MSEDAKKFDPLNPFDTVHFPLEKWAGGVKDWAFETRENFRPLREPLDWLINGIEAILQGAPQTAVLAAAAILAWQAAGRKVGIIVLAALIAMGMMGERAWGLGMTTLAIVSAAVLVCVVIGLPLGILAGKSDWFQAGIRPALDTMQTIPAFVYLVPVVILIGIGNASGLIVTIVFALPPLIRLTALGIRQVDAGVVEAARAFGANPGQILFKVELPLATPTIMAGVNQTIMLSLSMVVIASMISVKGFGNEVLRAMGRLDVGKALVGGVGIVILAVVLDRVTQGLGRTVRQRGARHWYLQGPAGMAIRFIRGLSGKAAAQTAGSKSD